MRVSMIFLLFRCRGWYDLAEIPSITNKYRLHNLHTLASYSLTRAVIFNEGDMATFFTGPRIGASSDENVPPPTTGHQKGQERPGVSVAKPFFPIFVWTRRLQVFQGLSVRTCFHANIRKSNLPMVNLQRNMMQKPDPTLEPSNYKQLQKYACFPQKIRYVHDVL